MQISKGTVGILRIFVYIPFYFIHFWAFALILFRSVLPTSCSPMRHVPREPALRADSAERKLKNRLSIVSVSTTRAIRVRIIRAMTHSKSGFMPHTVDQTVGFELVTLFLSLDSVRPLC